MNLCHLVDQSAKNLTNTFNHGHIVNDIRPDFITDTCGQSLRRVVEGLMNHAASYAKDDAIRIEAKRFSSVCLVQVRYNDSRKQPVADSAFEEIRKTAESIGGCLYISHNDIQRTTLSFTFPRRRYPAVA